MKGETGNTGVKSYRNGQLDTKENELELLKRKHYELTF